MRAVWIGLVLCGMIATPFAQQTAPRVLVSQREFNGYSFLFYKAGDYFAAKTIEVRRGDTLLFMAEGAITLVDSGLEKLGNDITGHGQPNAVIEDYTGGAHCCFVYYILELGKQFAILDTLDTRDAGARFEDRTHDGRLAMITGDYCFAYWNTYFAASPFPQVILLYRDGYYHVAEDLMRKPAPGKDSLKTLAEEVRSDTIWGPYTEEGGVYAKVPTALWRIMLDLIYTGHADTAWTFLDQAWPSGITGKERFLSDFRSQLLTSPYLSGLLRLNAGSLGKQR